MEEALNEYDIVKGPEEPRDPVDKSPASTTEETDKQKSEETVPADSSMENKHLGRKNILLDSHHLMHPPVEIICPRTNCTEKILFCLDFSKEMNETYFRSRAGDKLSAFGETVKALRMYVMNKNQINPNHEFGLAVFHKNAEWIKGFCRAKELLGILEDLGMQQTMPAGNFDLSKVFHLLQNHLDLPQVSGDVKLVPPPYIVRVLVVYGRSQHMPLFTDKEIHHQLELSPYFFIDVLYVHEPPSEENKCEEIFTRLCELDHKGLSYILEAASLTRLFDCIAMFLSHPLQRPLQRQADYHITDTP